MSFVSGEFRALQRSHCLDSGSAIMGFSQITVITLVVVIRGSFLGRQKASVSFILMCQVEFSMAQTHNRYREDVWMSFLLLIKKESQ